jgi:hypothetical protein
MKINHSTDPRPLRAKDYMPTGDQIDAILKGFRAIRDAGITLPAETLDWMEHCERVKSTYKKHDTAAP